MGSQNEFNEEKLNGEQIGFILEDGLGRIKYYEKYEYMCLDKKGQK